MIAKGCGVVEVWQAGSSGGQRLEAAMTGGAKIFVPEATADPI